MKNQKTLFVVLGLLSMKPLSGYDIKKIIDKSIRHFWSESNGQLYPTLRQLLKDGLVTMAQKKQNGKKVSHLYAITKKGSEVLEQWLEAPSEKKSIHRDEELLRLFFGNNACEAASLDLLKQRAQRAQEALSEYQMLKRELDARISHPQHLYWNLALNNGICHAEADLAWCHESIQALESICQSKA